MGAVIETTLSVNFGSRKGSLANVAYTLYNKTKSVIQNRTTTGVTELIAGTGLYQLLVELPAAFVGSIVWDTGEATKLYAIEDIDFRKFTYQSSVIVGGRPGASVWTEKEKKKILKDIRDLLTAIKNIKIVDNSGLLKVIESSIEEVKRRDILNHKFVNESLTLTREEVKKKEFTNYKFIKESLNLILSEVKKGDAIETLQEGIDKLSEGLVAIIENKEADSLVEEAKGYVKA